MAYAFTERWLDELKSKNDIVDVASSYTVLKQNGRKYIGLCPIHGEKTPSFHIDADKQLFYCFGCGRGGTVIQLVMECEHMAYREAIEFLAQRVHMPLPKSDVDSAELHRQHQRRERLRNLNRDAAKFFYEKLNSPEGEKARAYIEKRRIDKSIAVRFGLGYAPDSYNALGDAMRALGHTEEDMLAVGLLKRNDKGNTYDAFRDRVMFPIINTYGECIGFGGRIMGQGEPKYLNSPESPVFDKGANLYASNIIKKKNKINYVILCEGYVDVISMHSAGFDTAVASLGTAFTPKQAQLIKRFVSNVYLSYDGDGAGQKATLRALDILAEEGLRAKVIRYPDGMDPDDFIRANGSDGFRNLLKQAQNEAEYRVSRIAEKFDLKDADMQADFAAEAVEAMKEVSDPIMLETGLKLISDKTGYMLDTLYEQAGSKRVREQKEKTEPVRRMPTKHVKKEEPLLLMQGFAVTLAVEDKNCRKRMQDENWTEMFEGSKTESLFKKVMEVSSDTDIDAASFALSLDEEENTLFSKIMVESADAGRRDVLFNDCRRQLRIYHTEKQIERERNGLQDKMKDENALREAVTRLQQLNVKLQNLKKGGE